MNYYFSKKYQGYPGSPFMDGLKVDYEKCINCGLVISKTHREMSASKWGKLNSSWHHHFEDNNENRIVNQPPYAQQALALEILFRNKIINLNKSLDYAAGYGTLSIFLKKYFDREIKIYDPYVQSGSKNLNYVTQLSQYDLVINSAMFEHVISRKALDDINLCVRDEGALLIHTRISEHIPKDPNWFYLEPHVHTAFHTNKSMQILMDQWGYAKSIYCHPAKSWILFKHNYCNLDKLEVLVDKINLEFQAEYFYIKDGFVDFWKGV